MTDQEKIIRLKEIYQEFLIELNALKEKANAQRLAKIKVIEKQKIEQILDKIHKEL
ncbi:MAG: hypothetical protein UR94_C0024G0003 [Parcubacteria group bacterium GW2011_GWA2_36_10]|nr:MAG: hypothetical protein UR94_C0024G0003 [Parcubacteria group bacterium GW2011_GWA2_36_10]